MDMTSLSIFLVQRNSSHCFPSHISGIIKAVYLVHKIQKKKQKSRLSLDESHQTFILATEYSKDSRVVDLSYNVQSLDGLTGVKQFCAHPMHTQDNLVNLSISLLCQGKFIITPPGPSTVQTMLGPSARATPSVRRHCLKLRLWSEAGIHWQVLATKLRKPCPTRNWYSFLGQDYREHLSTPTTQQ